MPESNLLSKLQNSFIGRDTEYPTVDGKRSPRVYLDSAASTLMLEPAYKLGGEFLQHYASTHSDLHYSAKGASHAFEWAHQRVLRFVDASADEYCCFFAGSGATAGFNRLAASLSRARPEREIVLVSEMEHHSNDLPHRHHSARVIHVPCMGEFERYGGLDMEKLHAIFNTHGDKINYIAVTGASNVTGAITPLAEVAKLAHAHGAYLVVDASQMIAHAPVSMDEADIDLLVFSGHKIYAPGSPGAVIGRTSLLQSIRPAELGGGMVDDVYIAEYMPTKTLPDREEAGTPNIVGAITPLAEVAKLAHAHGAYLVVDASQMIAHAPVSMDEADINLLVFSGHKIYAPGSPGAVIGRTSLLQSIRPAELGGGMVDDVYIAEYMPTHTLPDREEAGTPNIVGAIMLGAVLDLLTRVGMDKVREKEIGLIDFAWKGLQEIEGVSVYGPNPDEIARTGTIAFNIKGFDHGLTAAAINDYHNIQVRNGCFCAHPYVRELLKRELWDMDIDPDALNSEADIERKRGMARASLGLYTTRADLEALLVAVRDLASRREEILALYEPIGSNGYRHKSFSPAAKDIFDPARTLQNFLEAAD